MRMTRLGYGPLVFALGMAVWIGGQGALGKVAYPPAQVLLSTSETVMGQPIAYPSGKAKVSAVIVTMIPGQETPWHEHDAPMFAYILDGEITVDYGPRGERTYRAGDSVMEAVKYRHRGWNSGSRDARLICVFIGADGVQNTVVEP